MARTRAGEEGLCRGCPRARTDERRSRPPAQGGAPRSRARGPSGPADWHGLIVLERANPDRWTCGANGSCKAEDAPLLAEPPSPQALRRRRQRGRGMVARARCRDAKAPGGSSTAGGSLTRQRPCSEQRDAMVRAAADADLTPPDNLRRVRRQRWLQRCTCQRDRARSSTSSIATPTPWRTDRETPDVLTQLGLYEETPRLISRRRQPLMPPATSWVPPRPRTTRGSRGSRRRTSGGWSSP